MVTAVFFAVDQRLPTQVVSIEFDHIEGAKKDPFVILPLQQIEAGDGVLVACNGLAVDDAASRAQAGGRLSNAGKAPGQIVPGPL